jgi:hypothetical protein
MSREGSKMIIKFIGWAAWNLMSPAKRANLLIARAKENKGSQILELDRDTIKELLNRSDKAAARYGSAMTMIYGGAKKPDGGYEWSFWARHKK